MNRSRSPKLTSAYRAFRDSLRDFLQAGSTPDGARVELAVAALVNSLGMILEIRLGSSVPFMPAWPAWISSVFGCIVLMILIASRRHFPRLRNRLWNATLFLLNTSFVVFALSMRDPYYAASVENWNPFQANKLGCFVSALLAPNFIVGLASISLHVGASIVQLWSFPPEIQSRLAFGEPLATFAFGGAGVLTLISRIRRMQIENQIVQLNAATEHRARAARRFLRVRDLMNTPLQIIELSIATMKASEPVEPETLRDLEVAARRLSDLNADLKSDDVHELI